MHGRKHYGSGQHMIDPEARYQQMYDRMDMMYLMMEQMMQHQHMMMRSNMYPR